MIRTRTISIRPDGTITLILDDRLTGLIAQGITTTRRASFVEPDLKPLRGLFHLLRHLFGEKGDLAWFTRHWPCRWRINLGPSGGPVIKATYRDRQEAIAAEVRWLERHAL